MTSFRILEDVGNENVAPKNVVVCRAGKETKKLGEKRMALQPLKQQCQISKECRQLFPLPKVAEPENDVEESINLPDDIVAVVNKANIYSPRLHRVSFRLSDNEEYEEEILEYLLKLEKRFQGFTFNYMSKQLHVNWEMRSVLIDWLIDVADEYKINEQTIHLSVNYLDRFLSNIQVNREKFQLVGAATMLIAGKIEEIYAPDAKEWVYLTDDTYNIHQILKMEQYMLKVLDFNLHPPTILDFINRLCAKHKMDAKTTHLAMYLSELVLLEGRDYLKHLPSKVGAASVLLARHTLRQEEPWSKKLEQTAGYSLKQLSPVVKKQHTTFKSSPFKPQKAIQTKYKSEKYHRVALLRPRALILDDAEDEE